MHNFEDSPVQRTVLYVEDDGLNALLMQALFERRPDLQLVVVPTCAEALRCARAQPPALLLLDLRLPDGHGAALLPLLRVLPGQRGVPAVAVTAEDLPGLNLHGFDDLWPKPLCLLHVLERLDHWLPRHRVRVQGPDGPPEGAVRMASAGPAAGLPLLSMLPALSVLSAF